MSIERLKIFTIDSDNLLEQTYRWQCPIIGNGSNHADDLDWIYQEKSLTN